MNPPEFDIKKQRTPEAGAGRGIRKGIAPAFAEADAAIAGLSGAATGQAAGEMRALGRAALPLSGDAAKSTDKERMAVGALREFGRADAPVNCVGDAIRKQMACLPDGAEGMPGEEGRISLALRVWAMGLAQLCRTLATRTRC